MSDKTKNSSSTSNNGITEEKKQPAPPADKPSAPAPAVTEKTSESKPSAPAEAEVKKETTPLPTPEAVQAEKPVEAENIVKPQPEADEPLAQETTPLTQEEPALATPAPTPPPSETPALEPDKEKPITPEPEEKPVSALAKEKAEKEIIPPVTPALNKAEVPVPAVPKELIEKPDKTPSALKQPSAPKTRLAAKRAKQPAPAESKPKIFKIEYLKKLTEYRGLANAKRKERVENNLSKIMEYALKTQKVTNDDVERIINVKDRQALKYLKKLVKQKKLIRFGKKRNTFYKPIKK